MGITRSFIQLLADLETIAAHPDPAYLQQLRYDAAAFFNTRGNPPFWPEFPAMGRVAQCIAQGWFGEWRLDVNLYLGYRYPA